MFLLKIQLTQKIIVEFGWALYVLLESPWQVGFNEGDMEIFCTFVLLESPWSVRFSEVDLEILRPKVCRILSFEYLFPLN